jgi:chaperone BCS1
MVLQPPKAGKPLHRQPFRPLSIKLTVFLSAHSLLFATTNHIERLDPALSRPGRMDVWVNFTHATKWQAEGIFKCFFPFQPAQTSSSVSEEKPASDAAQQNMPLPRRKHKVPLLSEDEISELAKRFAEAIPEDEFSVASLQGYLLKNKSRPKECVEEVAEWIESERDLREKMKKEKEEVWSSPSHSFVLVSLGTRLLISSP